MVFNGLLFTYGFSWLSFERQVLHVRSFLDHDRPYVSPVHPIASGMGAGHWVCWYICWEAFDNEVRRLYRIYMFYWDIPRYSRFQVLIVWVCLACLFCLTTLAFPSVLVDEIGMGVTQGHHGSWNKWISKSQAVSGASLCASALERAPTWTLPDKRFCRRPVVDLMTYEKLRFFGCLNWLFEICSGMFWMFWLVVLNVDFKPFFHPVWDDWSCARTCTNRWWSIWVAGQRPWRTMSTGCASWRPTPCWLPLFDRHAFNGHICKHQLASGRVLIFSSRVSYLFCRTG